MGKSGEPPSFPGTVGILRSWRSQWVPLSTAPPLENGQEVYPGALQCVPKHITDPTVAHNKRNRQDHQGITTSTWHPHPQLPQWTRALDALRTCSARLLSACQNHPACRLYTEPASMWGHFPKTGRYSYFFYFISLLNKSFLHNAHKSQHYRISYWEIFFKGVYLLLFLLARIDWQEDRRQGSNNVSWSRTGCRVLRGSS